MHILLKYIFVLILSFLILFLLNLFNNNSKQIVKTIILLHWGIYGMQINFTHCVCVCVLKVLLCVFDPHMHLVVQ